MASKSLKEEVDYLKRQSGTNILVGSPSLIIELMKLNLIDEYQFCIQPIVLGKGLMLFREINDRTNLKLLKTKSFRSGAVTVSYNSVDTK